METYGKKFNSLIAAELRAQRARKSMTIDEIVEASSMSRTAILNYLNDQRQIPMPAFFEMCSILGADPVELFAAANNQMQ